MTGKFIDGEYGQRLRNIVGEDHIDAVVESFESAKLTSFRVNTIKSNIAAVEARLSELKISAANVAWCAEAMTVTPEQRSLVTHCDLVDSGQIYVQGLSSIFATTVLNPKPEQWNLDLASAPGGKASHMAAMMHNTGKLSVVEPVKPRMYRLAANLKRLGVTISKTYLMDGRKVGRKVPNRFDCVMLDAPCSSDSRIRLADPESWKYWSPRKVREQARKQKGLIVSAFESLKPGGTMVYCTCSFSPEENEAVVSYLIDQFDEHVELIPIEMPFPNWTNGMESFDGKSFQQSVAHSRRILPTHQFDAFYIAKFRKR